MAVLKMWDGSAWVPVGAGAPAVASPLTVSGTGVIDINHIEEVGGAPNVGFVSEGGNVNLEAAYWAFLASNLRDDGTNWQRYRTTDKGLALAAEYGGALHLYDTPAGANPATLTERMRLSIQSTLWTLVQNVVANGQLEVAAPGTIYLAVNATFNGATGQHNRDDTGQPAALFGFNRAGSIVVQYAAAGANPISWSSYTLTDPAYPATGWLDLGTVAVYASGWGPYAGGNQFRPMARRFPDGTVRLRGLLAKSSAVTPGETMLTLNSGWRIGDTGYAGGGLVVNHQTSWSNGAVCGLEMYSTGIVVAGTGTNAAFVSIACFAYNSNP